MQIPKFPRHLTPAERRAVMAQAARDIAAETIKENGLTPASVDMAVVEAEAASGITLAWLIERVEALEAAAEGKQDDAGRTS